MTSWSEKVCTPGETELKSAGDSKRQGYAAVAQPAMLKVESIGHRFPRTSNPVLENVSLDVPRGGFVTLIGPSGCGKTSLLRIVAGLLEPTGGGAIFLDGELSAGPSPEKAMVFQQFHLFPWRTALANIAYGLELQGMKKRERLQQARKYLGLVGLDRFADYYPRELSGGMQQRVGLGRALATEPKMLLMDEPFGALDALTREHLQGELERICRSANATVLFVTHSIDEAIYLSDQVHVMASNPGRIVASIDVELPRPRADYQIRSDPLFAELHDRVWSQLQTELGPAHEQLFDNGSSSKMDGE